MGEDKKNGNYIKLLAIFLFIVILCLIGYIIFSGYNNNSDDVDNNIVDTSELLDISKLSNYMNYDGTYASIKSYDFMWEDGNIYSVSIDMEGRAYVGHYVNRKDITNISRGIDIVSVSSDTGLAKDYKYYILTDDGKIYEYSLYNILNNIYEAKLVDDIKDVKRVISYSYATREGTNSSSGVLAILDSGEYVRLD